MTWRDKSEDGNLSEGTSLSLPPTEAPFSSLENSNLPGASGSNGPSIQSKAPMQLVEDLKGCCGPGWCLASSHKQDEASSTLVRVRHRLFELIEVVIREFHHHLLHIFLLELYLATSPRHESFKKILSATTTATLFSLKTLDPKAERSG